MADPSSGDAFAIFGLTPTFDVHMASLRREWLRRSAALHPDRPGAPADAAERIAAINIAKETLVNPERRAAALLASMGETPSTRHDVLPPGFLVEMLEVREGLESAQASGDKAAIAAFEKWATDQRAEHERAFRERWAASPSPPGPGDLRELRTILNAWRYIERMIEQIDHDA